MYIFKSNYISNTYYYQIYFMTLTIVNNVVVPNIKRLRVKTNENV